MIRTEWPSQIIDEILKTAPHDAKVELYLVARVPPGLEREAGQDLSMYVFFSNSEQL